MHSGRFILVVLKCLFIFSFLENYSREEVRYPVSVSVYPEEKGAEGEAAKLVRNTSRVPLKYLSISWEREHKFITLSRWNSQDGGAGFGTIPIFQTRPSLLCGNLIVSYKQLSEETNLNDNGDWDNKVLARILLNRCEGNSRT